MLTINNMNVNQKPDLSQPQFDQRAFTGRVLHFLNVCNPFNIFLSDEELDTAKGTVEGYNNIKENKNQKQDPLSERHIERLWKAKYQYESAFHPDTGKKLTVFQRIPAYLPMKILLLSGMVTFYKTKSAVIFWQLWNQAYTTYVIASHQPKSSPITKCHWLSSYCAACGSAVLTALYLNKKARASGKRCCYLMRLVPFGAVCSAILIQTPILRQYELYNGTTVYAESTNKYVGDSTEAARRAALSCMYQCAFHFPGLVIAPLMTQVAILRGMFCYRPKMAIPFQAALVAVSTAVAAPFTYALFKEPVITTINIKSIEK